MFRNTATLSCIQIFYQALIKETIYNIPVTKGSVTEYTAKPRLKRDAWINKSTQHREQVASLVDLYVEEKFSQKQDPVMDFMFTYYKLSPSKLKVWTPGAGVLLEDADIHDDIVSDNYESFGSGEGMWINPASFPQKKVRGTTWILALLEATDHRNPTLNCCGMHEWAMVYEADEIRHQKFPLRLKREEIRDLVDSNPVVCSHFDAFRFFTPKAQPLNAVELSRETMLENEQPGCLHTNMDLYKWSYKLSPWIPADLTLEAFKMASKARVLDMKAGPYDLRSIGYEPIVIETEAGRRLYKEKQAEIWRDAQPLRKQLISCLKYILSHHKPYQLEPGS